MTTSTTGAARPKLVVFDLDHTLWPFKVDSHIDPAFTKKSDGKIYTRHGTEIECFPEVPKVLQKLKADGYIIAVASRSSTRELANTLISLFDWDKYITYREVYQGTKTVHFNKFSEATGTKFRDMLFFDDEMRNITELSKLGVVCIHVGEEGVTEAVVNRGLKLFAEPRQER